MSVRFDLFTDRISFSGAGLPDPASGFTLAMWIRVASSTGDFATFARLSAGGSTSATCATTSTGTGGPIYGTAGGTLTATAGMTVGTWYRYAITRTGTTGKLYTAEGAAGATEALTGTVSGADNPDQICFGGRAAADITETLNGNVAYAKLWSSVLTQGQIEAEWASAAPIITSGLAAFWPLTVHTDLTDHSGNGHDLTAGATAVTTEADPPLPAATGTASGTLGAPSGAAAGTPTVLGTAGKTLGALAGTAAGVPTVLGIAGKTLPGVAGTAVGLRTVTGQAVGQLGALTGHASVSAAVPGTGLGTLAALTGHATGSSPAADSGSGGGWWTLLAITQEFRDIAAQEAARQPVACPNDGEPYRTGPNGELYCPFDGHRP